MNYSGLSPATAHDNCETPVAFPSIEGAADEVKKKKLREGEDRNASREELVSCCNCALVVSAARINRETRTSHANVNLVVVAVSRNIFGRKSKGVLISRLFGQVRIEARKIIFFRAVEGVSSGV